MCCVYKMTVTNERDEEGKEYVGYGIEAWMISGTEQRMVQRVPDIFLERDRARRFVDLCNDECVELVHLFDVIDNVLGG